MYELAPQANQLASKGRYGDSMLVHMNPVEVDTLNKMSGNLMTVNPDTGQPEAFLPMLLPMLGGLLGAGAAGSAGLGILGTAGAIGLGSGIGSTAATGSLKQGIKTGLLSFGTAGVLGGLGSLGTATTPGLATAPLTTQAPTISGSQFVLGSQTTGNALTGIPSQVLKGTTLGGFNPAIGGTANPIFSTFADEGLKAGLKAATPALTSAAIGSYPTVMSEMRGNFDDYEESSPYPFVPEANPLSRTVRTMDSDFQGPGEFSFFEPYSQSSGPTPNYGASVPSSLPINYSTSNFGDEQNRNRMPQFPKNPFVRSFAEGGELPIGLDSVPDQPMMETIDPMMDEVDPMMESVEPMAAPRDITEEEAKDHARLWDATTAIIKDTLAGEPDEPGDQEILLKAVEIFGQETISSLVQQLQQGNTFSGLVESNAPDGEDVVPVSKSGEQPILVGGGEYILPVEVTDAIGAENLNMVTEAITGVDPEQAQREQMSA